MPRQRAIHMNTPGPARTTLCGHKLSEGWYTSVKDVVTCGNCLRVMAAKTT